MVYRQSILRRNVATYQGERAGVRNGLNNLTRVGLSYSSSIPTFALIVSVSRWMIVGSLDLAMVRELVRLTVMFKRETAHTTC